MSNNNRSRLTAGSTNRAFNSRWSQIDQQLQDQLNDFPQTFLAVNVTNPLNENLGEINNPSNKIIAKPISAKLVPNVNGSYSVIDSGTLLPTDSLPDIDSTNNLNEFLDLIKFYSSLDYLVAEAFNSDLQNIPLFGQIVKCTFQVGDSNKASALRMTYEVPAGKPVFYEKYLDKLSNDLLANAREPFSSNPAFLLGDHRSNEVKKEEDKRSAKNGLTSNLKGQRTEEIKFIVIHYSAGFGDAKTILQYENTKTEYGYHYMINRDGTYLNTAPPDQIVWHAKGDKNTNNSNSIGICLMNLGYERKGVPGEHKGAWGTIDNWVEGTIPHGTDKLRWEPYTNESIDTLVNLCVDLIKKFPGINVNNIVGHSDIQKNKQDPGPAFDFESFREKVKSKLA